MPAWRLSRWIETRWYQDKPLYWLAPFAWLFKAAVKLRRLLYDGPLRKVTRLPVPVIIIGNLSVGGTGKTPLVIWTAQWLTRMGYKPGIISRGYGGQAPYWPQWVYPESDPDTVGDEALLIAQRTQCSMCVGPERVRAAQVLIEKSDCTVILSDDGLQHYALGRDIEIAVIDGKRRFGNGYCLPAGPLREPVERLRQVDLIVCNGLAKGNEHAMVLEGSRAVNLHDAQQTKELAQFKGQRIHALAGIGHPGRFFAHLSQFGLLFDERIFPDHHAFQERDILFDDNRPVLMTEKDAIKCRRFVGPQHWFVPVEARLDEAFAQSLLNLLQDKAHGP